MRLLCVLILLACLNGLQGTEGKKENGKKAKSKSNSNSGELTTKDNHRCTWETSGEVDVSLLVNCNLQDKTYWCRYAGQPDLCPSYRAKPSQFWKQVVGRLKKKRNACDGDKILKTRMCKKAPDEAQMKLSQKSSPEESVPEKVKIKGSSKKKEVTPEVSSKKKEKMAPIPEPQDLGEVNDDNTESEVEPIENYCAEGWDSFCRIFVKLFNG
ncbi:fibroblast growth factor-binding protein 2 [Polypterus senegalus]